jgi:hypothetical protein
MSPSHFLINWIWFKTRSGSATKKFEKFERFEMFEVWKVSGPTVFYLLSFIFYPGSWFFLFCSSVYFLGLAIFISRIKTHLLYLIPIIFQTLLKFSPYKWESRDYRSETLTKPGRIAQIYSIRWFYSISKKWGLHFFSYNIIAL